MGPAAVQTEGEAGYLLAWQSFVLSFWGTRGKSRSCPLGSQIALSLSAVLSVGERTPRVLTDSLSGAQSIARVASVCPVHQGEAATW